MKSVPTPRRTDADVAPSSGVRTAPLPRGKRDLSMRGRTAIRILDTVDQAPAASSTAHFTTTDRAGPRTPGAPRP